jgi:hypothetical protein
MDLVLGALALQNPANGQLSMQNDTCSGQTLPPSAACTVDVRFSPVVLGNIATALSIPSNDPDTPTLDVPVGGVSEQGAVYPVRGTIGTEVTLTGSGFGDRKPKVWLNLDGKTAKFQVLSWNDTEIRGLWKKRALPGVYDLWVKPRKADAVALGPFEIRNPEIDLGMPGGPYQGAPGDEVTLFGFYFSTQKPKVTLSGGGLARPKKCKVMTSTMYPYPLASWGEGEALILVPNLDPGTYDLTVSNKVGTHTQVGGFQVK